jgi:hypothetical protein
MYLPSLPADPYGGGRFQYHISPGERLLMIPNVDESKAYKDVPAGTAIVWSVGPNLHNDGGRIQERSDNYNAIMTDGDVLFIVPRVRKP